jgi:hypothetical protein
MGLFLIAGAVLAAPPKVFSVEGTANMKKPGATDWTPLVANMEVPEGARIQTRLNTRLTMVLDNNARVTLSENSIFEVIRSANNRFEFRLWVGDVRSRVPSLGAGQRFTVRTPTAVAGIRGTDFLVSTEENGRTSVSVYEGAVDFRSIATGNQVIVGANQSAAVSATGEMSAVQAGVTRGADDDGGSGASSDGASSGSSSGSATSAPLTVLAPQEGAVVSNRQLTVIGSAGTGASVMVNGAPAMSDGSGRWTATVTLAEGPNAITVVAGTERRDLNVTLDSLRPEISLSAYPEVTNVPVLSLTVTTKANATVTAGGFSTVASGGMASLQLNLSEGENLITIRAADERGLSSERSIRVTLDTIKPRVTITSLTPTAAGVRVSGLTEAGVTVTANGYPLEVRSDGSFDQVLSGLSATDVTFEARDRAGNITREMRNVSGAVDNAPPTLVSFALTPTEVTPGQTSAATLTVADASDVISQVTLTLVGPGGQSITTTLIASGKTYQGTISVPPTASGGVWSVGPIAVSDVLGNATTLAPSASLTVRIPTPASPSGLTASAISSSRIDLGWSPVSGATSYRVYRSLSVSGGAPWYQLAETSSAGYSITGLARATSYHFTVTSVNLQASPSESTQGTATASATTAN